MNELTRGEKVLKKQYVKEYYDYSSGKDRRITKLDNDIKILDEEGENVVDFTITKN